MAEKDELWKACCRNNISSRMKLISLYVRCMFFLVKFRRIKKKNVDLNRNWQTKGCTIIKSRKSISSQTWCQLVEVPGLQRCPSLCKSCSFKKLKFNEWVHSMCAEREISFSDQNCGNQLFLNGCLCGFKGFCSKPHVDTQGTAIFFFFYLDISSHRPCKN